MKKLLAFISIIALLALAACGGGDKADDSKKETEGGEDTVTLKIGATSVPHAEILEKAKPILEEEGIILEIEEYQDYVLPNDDLANGTLDANYFQHVPYLEQTIADTGYDLVSLGEIHSEPMGVYSKSINSIEEIPDGTEVILSNSVSDHPRILKIFADAGLIKLDEKAEEITFDSIVENPKNLKFSPGPDPASLPEMYEYEEDALVVINTNYALEAGLNPSEDAVFFESEDSVDVHPNIIAVRGEDKDNEALKKLVEVLQSEEMQNFMLEEYGGAVIPAGGNK